MQPGRGDRPRDRSDALPACRSSAATGPGPRGTARGGVVGRGELPAAQAGHPPQPADVPQLVHPDRRPGPLHRPRFEHYAAGGGKLALEPAASVEQQQAQHLHVHVEARPPLLEGKADGGVVAREDPSPTPATTCPPERISSAARDLASCTGPRTTGRPTVVTSLSAVRDASMSVANAVGPSSHGRPNTRWSSAQR